MPRKSRKGTGTISETVATVPLYKVGLYARLSVEDIRKKESNSIGTQISLLKQYVSEQADMTPFDVYEDIDKTGTNFNRPGFNRLLDDIRTGKVNCIVVKDLSRFGRNHIETGNYLERVFPFMGVRFVAIGDNYDSNSHSSSDDLTIPLKNLVNEVYAKDISKKVRSQYETKRQRGDFCGAFAPYGYIKKGNALVVDETAAEVVTRIFQLVIEGYSDNAITAILNADGILPPNRHRYEQGILKGKKHSKAKYWYKSVVKRITQNTAYLGRLEQGRYKTGLMNGGARIHIAKDDWVVALDTHTAIIDEATFEAVQELRKNRKQIYDQKAAEANRPKSTENIFKGLIFCSDCLRNLSRQKIVRANGKLDYRYLCPTYQEVDRCRCTKKNLLESELIPLIHAFIEMQIKTLTDIKSIIEDVCKQANYANKMERVDDSLSKAKKSLAKVVGLQNSLYEDFKEGLLSKDDYKLVKATYTAQHKELTEQIENLSSQKTKHTDMVGQNKWAAAFNAFSVNKELSRELMISIIERIEVDRDNNVAITVRYRDEQMALLSELTEYLEVAV